MCNNSNQINPSITPISNPILDISFERGKNKYFLEASAGTGKTYALMHIVLRLIVEQKLPIERILLVTYTNPATDELKTRIRELLNKVKGTLQNLDQIQAGVNKLDDEILKELLNRWQTSEKRGLQALVEAATDKGSEDKTITEKLKQYAFEGIKDLVKAAVNRELDEETLDERLKVCASEEIRTLINTAANDIEDISIHTIHSFCQKMLLQFPFSSKNSFSMEVADESSLIHKTVDKVVRMAAKKITCPKTKRVFLSNEKFSEYLDTLSRQSRLKTIEFNPDPTSKFNGELKVSFDDTKIHIKFGIKADEEINTSEMEIALEFFFEAAPKYFRKLKQQNHVIDYNDMLCQMEENLKENTFVENIRDAYDAILIDEFQDTDSIQCSIFETIFLDSEEKIVIFVGDPKQSIYNWRNADIESYLRVKSRKGIITKKLEKNFRSTPSLVEAANIFFSNKPSSFRDSRLIYSPIGFNEKRLPLFLRKKDGSFEALTPFEFWLEHPKEQLCNGRTKQLKYPGQFLFHMEEFEACAVAEDIAQLLKRDIFLGNPKRPLRKSDIAVLVRARRQAEGLGKELANRGLRYQIDDKTDVFNSNEASEIFLVLLAMENPKDRKRVNGARSTRIFGEKLSAIVNDEEARDRAYRALEQATKTFASKGILAAFTELFSKFSVENRLLGQPSCDRLLTNYRHILELLYEQNRKVKTVSGLVRWMQNSVSDEKRKLKRNSDDDLIQINTIHSSKGLEYPVVYMLRAGYVYKTPTDDELKEAIRLAYVAFTRASSRLVIPMFYNRKTPGNGFDGNYSVSPACSYSAILKALAPNANSAELNNELFELDEKPHLHTRLKTLTTDKQKPKNLRKVLEEAVNEDDCPFKGKVSSLDKFEAGAIYKFRLSEDSKEIQKLTFEDETVVSRFKVNQDTEQKSLESFNQESLVDPKQIPSEDDLKPARFDQNNPSWRKPDWTQTSFTGLTKGLHWSKHDPAMDEPTDDDADNVFDEGLLKNKPNNVSAASFGSFLHKLLEDLKDEDFQHISKIDLASFVKLKSTESRLDEDSKAVLRYVRTKLLDLSPEPPPDALALDLTEMLIHVLQVNGFKDLGDFQLCQLKDNERISEMDFLIKTRDPSKSTNLSAKELGELLENLDKQKYTGLNLSDKKELNGYLNGSIDLVFYHNEKFWIIDWKSNKLKNYHQDTLEREMKKNHYKLQYLLYTVALKRFLESRGIKDAYKKIGGVAYFFLRGINKDNPESGIYFERPEDSVIQRLDEVLL